MALPPHLTTGLQSHYAQTNQSGREKDQRTSNAQSHIYECSLNGDDRVLFYRPNQDRDLINAIVLSGGDRVDITGRNLIVRSSGWFYGTYDTPLNRLNTRDQNDVFSNVAQRSITVLPQTDGKNRIQSLIFEVPYYWPRYHSSNT